MNQILCKTLISVSVSRYETWKGLKLGHGKPLNQLHFWKLRTINEYSSSLRWINCISADPGSNPNEPLSCLAMIRTGVFGSEVRRLNHSTMASANVNEVKMYHTLSMSFLHLLSTNYLIHLVKCCLSIYLSMVKGWKDITGGRGLSN